MLVASAPLRRSRQSHPVSPAIKAQFTEAHRSDFFSRFELDATHRLLSDWHAFTFEVARKGEPYILRITDDRHRPPALIEGELEWQRFVRDRGIVAPGIVKSARGRDLESVAAVSCQFTAVLFEKLDGRAVAPSNWHAALFRRWGALVGRLHAISRDFRPQQSRPAWKETDFLNIDAYIPDPLVEIRQAAVELLYEIDRLGRDASVYGMIHADVYQDNFLIGAAGLQLFDFDNCEYGYFVSDIATALYAALWRLGAGEDRQAFAHAFLAEFLAGYQAEYHLPAAHLARLPLFLRLRELLIYIVARKKLDLNHLTPLQARLLQERGDRIARRIPVVNVSVPIVD